MYINLGANLFLTKFTDKEVISFKPHSPRMSHTYILAF